MMLVVTYDVNTETTAGKRRLRRVAKTCMKYGQRVQNSVFDCLVTPSERLTLIHELEKIMDVDNDSLRLYNLGSRYSSRIEYRGTQRHLPRDDVMIVRNVKCYPNYKREMLCLHCHSMRMGIEILPLWGG